MNIRVKSAYSGVLTQGRTITPGVYAPDDARLIDAADTMIRKGFAVYTDEPVPVELAPPPTTPSVVAWDADADDVIGVEVREDIIPVAIPADEPAFDYDSLTTAELRELAEAAALEVVGTGKNGTTLKADYVRALKAAEA